MLDRSTRGDPPKFWSPIDRVRAPSAANFSRAASPTILPSPGGFHRFGQLAASVKDQPSFGNHRVWQLFAGKIPGMFAQQSRSCQHRPARISLVILAGLLSFRRPDTDGMFDRIFSSRQIRLPEGDSSEMAFRCGTCYGTRREKLAYQYGCLSNFPA